MRQPWFVPSNYEENKEHSSKAEGNRKAGSEQNPVDCGQRTHRYHRLILADARRFLREFGNCALDRQARGI